MTDERATSSPGDWPAGGAGYGTAPAEFAELRELLVGSERRQLEDLKRRLDDLGLTPEQLAEHLPQAIALRAAQDRQLARALAPTVEGAISESVRRNPRDIATAIFPVLGPAIRKAIAEAMAGLVASINRAVQHSLSLRGLKWRVESWRTGIPYAEIVLKHALIYRVEQVYLIHTDTGILLSHAASDPGKAEDADLISGMLTAIRDFVADSFAGPEAGGLSAFTVGELTVTVQQGPQATLAAVIRGQPPEAIQAKFQDTLETVHLRFAGPFADFDGDTGAFEPAEPLLAGCLETVLGDEQPRRGWTTLVWVLPLVLLLLIPVWMGIRSSRQWTTAVSRLEAEPGIVLVRAQRDGGRWRFAGLRDPLAAEPAAVLASAGFGGRAVEARWEPYHSFHPGIVLERARRALTPPSGVTLTLSGDTLRAAGAAPLEWVVRTSAIAALPSGVGSFDPSRVDVTLPADLRAARSELESARVLFPVGSVALGPTVSRTLAGVVDRLRQLTAALGPLGYRLTVELTGRTDSTGTEALNQNLSLGRAEAVRSALVERGIAPGVLIATGLGTSRPLTAADDQEKGRINRSVTFRLEVQSGTRHLARVP